MAPQVRSFECERDEVDSGKSLAYLSKPGRQDTFGAANLPSSLEASVVADAIQQFNSCLELFELEWYTVLKGPLLGRL